MTGLRLLSTLWTAGCLALLIACGGNAGQGSETGNTLPVKADPVAADIDPALQKQLEQALDEALLAAGRTRETRAAASGPASMVVDLTVREFSAMEWVADWTYRNQGDYDLNGEVNVSDLTPLGQNFLKTQQSPDWITAQWSDGDGNGEDNLADVTAIGQNFGAILHGYELQGNVGSDEIWHSIALLPHTPASSLSKSVIFDKVNTYFAYRVVPYFDNNSIPEFGTPSNLVYQGLGASAWPMLGGNPQHDGQSQAAGPDQLNIYAEVPLEGQIFASNPVADAAGSVYICTTFPGEGYGYIYGVSNEQQIMFRHRTRAEIITTPVIDDLGRISAVDVDGNLYCLAPDGKLYHEVQLPGGEATSPICLGTDLVLATNGDHQLSRLDGDGQILWQSTFSGTTLASPALLDNGNMVLPTVTGLSYFLDPSGATVWVSTLGVQFLQSPCVDGNIPYCGSFANQGLYEIRTTTNGVLLYGLPEGATSIPSLAGNGNILIGSSDYSATPPTGMLTAVDNAGVFQWNIFTAVPLENQTVVDATGRMYVSGYSDPTTAFVFCFEADRSALWNVSVAPFRPMQPVITGFKTMVLALTPGDGSSNTSGLMWIRPDNFI